MTSKIIFFGFTTVVILALNLTPAIKQVRHVPQGRTFPLIHNNTQDYYFYLALMNEGANGSWLTYDPYTSESHQPSIIFSYFLWLGKLSKLLGISYALMYLLTRIILGALFLFTVYCLLFIINIPYPRVTFLFFLFSAPFLNTNGTPYMSWWNGIDPIRRAAFLPHHMLGSLLFILSIILIFKYINLNQLTNTADRHHLSKIIFRKNFLLLILLSALMAFVHTPSLLILLLILPPSLFFYFAFGDFRKLLLPSDKGGGTASPYAVGSPRLSEAREARKSPLAALSFLTISLGKQRNREKLFGIFIYWFIGILFLVIMVTQTRNGFPWSQYIDWEKNLQFPLSRELLGAMGILLPFSIIGIFSALKSKKFEYIFIASWLVIPFLFIPLAPKLNLSNIRLIQGVPYLPLAILGILGIKELTDFVISNKIFTIRKDLKTPRGWQADPPAGGEAMTPPMVKESEKSGRTRKLILLIIILVFSIFTFPTLQWSLRDQIREYWPIYSNVYLDNKIFDAADFINLNIPPKTVTLSTFYTGNYLPAYTNTVSFIGHFGYTYKQEEKEAQTKKFFENKMSVQEAKDFLSSNKITLVFQGPDEKPLYKDYLYPSLLKIIYDKEATTLYKPNYLTDPGSD